MKSNIPYAVVILLIAAAWASAEAPAGVTPDLNALLAKMERAQAEQRNDCTAYRLIRNYSFFKEGQQQPSSEFRAEVQFTPPNQKSYTIQEAKGSGQAEKIVRKMLDHESEISKNRQGSSITRENYDFQYVRNESWNGKVVDVLALLPKRNDKELIRGQLWMDDQTGYILRLEGEPAKSPSWWVKSVQLQITFDEVAGVWVQKEMRVVANVRMIGKHTVLARNLSVVPAALEASNRRTTTLETKARSNRRFAAETAASAVHF